MKVSDMGLGTSERSQCQQKYIPQKKGICFAFKQDVGYLVDTIVSGRFQQDADPGIHLR